MNFKKSLSFFLALSFALQSLSLPIDQVLANQDETKNSVEKNADVLPYASLMREFNAVKEKEIRSVGPLTRSNTLQFQQSKTPEYETAELEEIFDEFVDVEKEKLDELGVDSDKQEQYFERLEKQQSQLENPELFIAEDVSEEELKEVKIPENPSEFKFQNAEIEVKTFGAQVEKSFLQKVLQGISFLAVPETKADYELADLPELADLESDAGEIVLDAEIYALANELDNNPVKIFNFVRNQIDYEPYYGAKKGALGCLEEGVCNDTDGTSLTIALMRAAGIPARYQKDYIYVPVEQLQELLGVAETKTVYAAFYWNKVPVYVDANSSLDLDDDFDDLDFSEETHLILEWTYPEIFYEQDERGGNFSNETVFTGSGIDTTTDLRNALLDYPKKQWIVLDAMMKGYSNTHNEIVADTANFDTAGFWRGFLQYAGDLSPLEKYAEELLTETAKEITDSDYQSVKTLVEQEFEILVPALPYEIISNSDYPAETWSELPDAHKHKVTISLFDGSGATVLSAEFNASEVNNAPLDLFYAGATETDQDIIESYGGIHATPAELVEITPFLTLDYAEYTTNTSVEIGDLLTLEFEYSLGSEVIETSSKYSVAGNAEGIFLTFSQIAENSVWDDESDDNRNSKILLEGNAEIARQYLLRLQENGEILKKALDLEYNLNFARAVVTQNRVLTKVGGVPTTFDFKGLTIDAAASIQDYSRRGAYANHREDFHLLWGLQASYDEADIFEDVAGLEAISTVQGLQYAYANSNDYTVYEIESSNESVIDSLTNLSENTRANMHIAVQSGSTVITPDNLITADDWYGVLYIVLRSDGSARYAIGEQVMGNGGWSIGFNTEIVEVEDESTGIVNIRFKQENETGENIFIFAEDERGESKQCFMTQTQFSAILADTDFDALVYGMPCMKETKTFGSVEHTYILATDGAKFYSDGSYNYWRPEWWVRAVLQNDLSNADLDEAVLDMTFKFNAIAGTYSYTGSYDDGDEPITAYYEPNSDDDNRGNGWVVYGGFLEKLEDDYFEILPEAENCDENDYYCKKGMYQWVLNGIGFPTSNRDNLMSSKGTIGNSQEFVNGRIYKVNGTLFDSIYYVPKKITTYLDANGGVVGDFGLPGDDPQKGDTSKVYQPFENEKDIVINADSTVGESEFVYYNCDLYGDVWAPYKLEWYRLHGFVNGIKDSVEGIASLVGFVASFTVFSGKLLIGDEEAQNTLDEIKDVIKSFSVEQLLNSVDGAIEGAPQAIYQEIQENSCRARGAYLQGEFVGAFLGFEGVLQGLKWSKNLPGMLKIAYLKKVKKLEKFNFKSDKKLFEHFDKHKAEFNFQDEYEYLSAANNLIEDKTSLDLLVKILDSGDVVKYNVATNELITVTNNGIISTFFKPHPQDALHPNGHLFPTNLDYFYSLK